MIYEMNDGGMASKGLRGAIKLHEKLKHLQTLAYH